MSQSADIDVIDRKRADPHSLDARVGRLVEAKTELELAKKAKARATWDRREAAFGERREIAEAVQLLELSVACARASLTRQEIGYAAAQAKRPVFERDVLRDILRSEERAQQRGQERGA